MVRADYADLLEQLDEAISKDQVYICRDLLEQTDKVVEKVQAVRDYYEANESKLIEVRKNIDKVTELLDTLKSADGWTKAKEKK